LPSVESSDILTIQSFAIAGLHVRNRQDECSISITGEIIMRERNNRAENNQNQDELGPDSAGQSGDLQGISDVADADSESVKELLEQGNAFEAEAIDGVENAKDAGVAEVRTRQVPEDDVPAEYLDDDEHVA
jgi:hypothetical protein